jgi:aminopeptidase N
MPGSPWKAACLAALPLLPLAAGAPLSDRIVAYKIDGRYDAKAHVVTATETLTYVNKTGQALDRFPFHLYLNGFQPKATWIKEAHRDGSRDFNSGSGWDPKKTGAQEIQSFEVEGMGDLKGALRFVAPDDGNPDDRTVVEVQLPKAIAPGASVTFRIGFKATFPEVVARTGYKRDFLLAGQWFPKVGVWWKGQWNCHQFHASTEFFADYGTYDVTLTLPASHVFGSTGVVTREHANADGTKTITAHAEDVHDFAWTADPRYVLSEDDVQVPSGRKHIRVLMQPGREDSARRYVQALKGTMTKFEEWYGPYPYPQITVVDPPHGGGAAGGMEYPMFITADTNWLMPKGALLPEIVTEHEFGHQYWYGLVGSNEFEHAWMDEGLNSYSEVKVMDALYGRTTSAIQMPFGHLGERSLQRLTYSSASDADPMSRNGWQYMTGNSYGGVTYGKTATVLLTLEHLIGEAKVQEALRVYFLRFRFKHPTEEDFFATVNEVAGQDLGWYWQQAVRGTATLDYRVLRARSTPTEWYAKPSSPSKPGARFDSQVIVHRKGDFVYPVTIQATFDNGEVVRERWDGQDRWHRWEWTKPARLVSAEVNADGAILLDLNRFNDSYTVSADSRATRKVGGYWTVLTQWASQLLSWLA